MENLIFEAYLDHYCHPPAWRWRGIDPETNQVLVVNSSDTYETQEAAARGALDFIHTIMDGYWALDASEDRGEIRWRVVRARA